VHLNGSFETLVQLCLQQGFFETLSQIWIPYIFGTPMAWKIITLFILCQLAFMRFLPGKTFHGPLTPQGNIPVYKANGVAAFLGTLFLFWLCAYPLELFSPTIIYDHFGGLIGALNCLSFILCIGLYIKGIYFPSSTDTGKSGNFIFDFYWGTELYPRVFGWDIKMLTNCRCGMMGWAIIILSFAAKQQEMYGLSNSMLISVALQLMYIFKFFYWETGYLRSLDIMHDRAGFYICWGCLVWVPSIYTSPSLYLVNHPNDLSTSFALFCFLGGAAAIFINYQADRQRQILRATNGKCQIWGKEPKFSIVSYMTRGERKENLLLQSGWWGISRHFHYVPEIMGAFFWTLPALFDNFLPYFYVVFLTILLFDRSVRDDKRCLDKYGEGWKKHSQKIKYKIIPLVW
jgi:7-dehydrocholesterol reductase